MERVTGIEPAFSAWEADVLPLNYTRDAATPYRGGAHRLHQGPKPTTGQNGTTRADAEGVRRYDAGGRWRDH